MTRLDHILDRLTIVSGGQTGADRAALDFAIEHGISHGGWCPRGRLAEDGPLDAIYRLRETRSRSYRERTLLNVLDSDATAVFTNSPGVSGGTALTLAVARDHSKPCLHLVREAAENESHAARLLAFLEEHSVERLNVAGPRASQEPEIGQFVREVLSTALLTARR